MTLILKPTETNSIHTKNEIYNYFINACLNGNLEKVNEVFSTPQYLEKLDNSYLSIGLERACKNGNVKIAKLILEKPSFTYISGGQQPLVIAARNNREKVIKLLLMHPKGREYFSIHDEDKKHIPFINEVVKSKDALKIVKFLHSNKKLKENLNLEDGALTLKVCATGNLELFKFVYNDEFFINALSNHKENIANQIFSLVLRTKNQEFLKYIVSDTKLKDYISFEPTRYDIMGYIINNMSLETIKVLDSSLDFITKRINLEKTENKNYTSLLSWGLRCNDISVIKYIFSHPLFESIEDNKLSSLYDTLLHGKYNNLSYILMDKDFIKKYDSKAFLEDFLNLNSKYASDAIISNFLFSLEKNNYKPLYIFKEAFEKENISDWQNKLLQIILKHKHKKTFNYFLDNITFIVSEETLEFLRNKKFNRFREFEDTSYQILEAKKLSDKLSQKLNNESLKRTPRRKI